MNETNAIAVHSPKDLLAFLNKSKSAIDMALPKHLNPDRMIRLALTCFSTQPAVRRCTPQSILASIVVASQLGLEPGIAGQGYLIPYGDTCTFIPGWQGLVGLLNNTGRATAWTGAVFEGDDFEYQLGSHPKIDHRPGENFGDPDKLEWVYACGQVNGSEHPVIEAWPLNRIRKHRDKFNKVGAKHYSFQHFEMYARKVVLLQVLKYMPRSIELNNAIVAANAEDAGKSVRVEDGVVVEVETAASPEFKEAKSEAGRSEVFPEDKQQEPKTEAKKTTKPPETPREPVKPASSEPVTPVQYIKRLMTEASVPFDDFRDYVTNQIGGVPDIDSWASYDDVSTLVAGKLCADPKAQVKILKTYGKKPDNA